MFASRHHSSLKENYSNCTKPESLRCPEWREKKSIKNFNFTMTIMALSVLDCDFNVSFSVGKAFYEIASE